MKCNNCGGALIWDYREGIIVCERCGLVFDKIILDHGDIYGNRDENSQLLTIKRVRQYSKRGLIKYRTMLDLYYKGLRMVKDKPWLEIDYTKVFEHRRFVKTIRSIASIKACENIEKRGYWDVIKEGMEIIEKINPAFLNRSDRGKYALAYIFMEKMRTGRFPDKEKVMEIFNISDTNYKRLCSLALKIMNMANTTGNGSLKLIKIG
ncbi:MAG: TFIIB-type zinc ribbon-containing protein [Desulfurococcaceae archaeon]